jgi:hypothetical protein
VLIYLLPVGRNRLELYAEPPEADDAAPAHDAGRIKRWIHQAGEHWRRLVDKARMDDAVSRFGRWRDALVCRLAESIEEQRTMWALRTATSATAIFPSELDAAAARAVLTQILIAAQRHHGRWLAIDLVLFIASGILFFVPGPNIVAYYLGFRAFGHLQSWRGARQGSAVVQWAMQPSDDLAELAALAEQPHAVRAARVAAIAARLELPHLPAFFERAAA